MMEDLENERGQETAFNFERENAEVGLARPSRTSSTDPLPLSPRQSTASVSQRTWPTTASVSQRIWPATASAKSKCRFRRTPRRAL